MKINATRVRTSLVLVLLLCFTGAMAQQEESARFAIEAEVVRVPVTVIDKEGRLYGGLEKGNFKLLEDGEPREIVNFVSGEEPLTVVLLLEDSRLVSFLKGEILRPAAIFTTEIMGEGDYAALVAFSNRPEILVDFTRNRQKLLDAIYMMARSSAGFSDSNLFDAIKFTVAGGVLDDVEYKGLAEVEGRTGVLLVASGRDTFSKLTLSEAREVAANAGVPIYSIGIGELAYLRAEPYLSGIARLDYLQSRSILKAFSDETGGQMYSVRFPGALDDVLQSIAAMLTHQFVLGYRPGPGEKDGERREIEVQVDVDGDGQPDNDRLDLNFRRYFYEPDQD